VPKYADLIAKVEAKEKQLNIETSNQTEDSQDILKTNAVIQLPTILLNSIFFLHQI